MCDIDLDRCEVWDERHVVARKLHGCDCCNGPILPGERYVRHFSRLDGEITSEKMCAACDSDRTEFATWPGHMQTNPSYFPELIQSCLDEDDESEDLWRPMLERIEARADRFVPDWHELGEAGA